MFLYVIWAMYWCIFFWGHQVYSFYDCKVTIQALFHLCRLRRRGGSDERGHPAPRQGTSSPAPLSPRLYGCQRVSARTSSPALLRPAHVAFIYTLIYE